MAIDKTKKLDIGIAGAGIAGLSAAVALSQAGHKVDITACPNAARVLSHWGFDLERWLPAEANAIKLTDVEEGVLQEYSWNNFEELYGSKVYLYHRVDLHSGLKDLAQSCGAVIHVKSEVQHIDHEAGILTLKGGAQHRKDLIVVADGIHVSLHLLPIVLLTCQIRPRPHRITGLSFVPLANKLCRLASCPKLAAKNWKSKKLACVHFDGLYLQKSFCQTR